jgi:Alcohol dehydrogenase GroES-like domain
MREGIHPETPQLPFTPGWDLVGEVDRLGDGVTGIEPGQIVAALPISGGYAEFVCLPQRALVPVSDVVSRCRMTGARATALPAGGESRPPATGHDQAERSKEAAEAFTRGGNNPRDDSARPPEVDDRRFCHSSRQAEDDERGRTRLQPMCCPRARRIRSGEEFVRWREISRPPFDQSNSRLQSAILRPARLLLNGCERQGAKG